MKSLKIFYIVISITSSASANMDDSSGDLESKTVFFTILHFNSTIYESFHCVLVFYSSANDVSGVTLG